MKEKTLKKYLIEYLSLFFDIRKKYLNDYLLNYDYYNNLIKLKLLFRGNTKVEIWILDNINLINLNDITDELIIIEIKTENRNLLTLERNDNISYYKFDIIKAINIFPKNKKENNLKKAAYIYRKLKLKEAKKHDIIKKRRNL